MTKGRHIVTHSDTTLCIRCGSLSPVQKVLGTRYYRPGTFALGDDTTRDFIKRSTRFKAEPYLALEYHVPLRYMIDFF